MAKKEDLTEKYGCVKMNLMIWKKEEELKNEK